MLQPLTVSKLNDRWLTLGIDYGCFPWHKALLRPVTHPATILHKDLSSALYIAVTHVEGVVHSESTYVCAYVF